MNFKSKHIGIIALVVLAFWTFTGCEGGASGKDSATVGGDYPLAPEAVRNTTVELTDGTSYRLADREGKVVLINLWAIWCGPCRNEIPELVKLEEKYRDKGFEVVGLDVDPEPLEQIGPFAEKMGINYKLGWASEDLVMAFFDISGRNGIPQSFLVNRKGELQGVFFGGGHETIEKMKEVVGEVVESGS
ncbi:MAG: TlpA family protein disulfide reductase [Acidobacteria bacterium]|nr:MAG: TlpA family protein disulfide reductase [Acidobacteriota bacterium]REK02207.1 MAG: TlpA family protein disulfide reductase [Acidobacteriota bacterium]REK13990.1 MAG: TlpA family protein disulfide reductase [Acidobacteriota bacterium]REK41985.1 MAG: TlpA family protein disulfide reductase [Acidobacteriota bacterium]